MNWLLMVGTFLKGLWTGVRAARAAKAGAELNQGEREVGAVDKDVADIEAELKRARDLAEPPPPATPQPTPSNPATPSPR